VGDLVDQHLAIRDSLATLHNAALDLRDTGAILFGRYTHPPRIPFVGISAPNIRSTQGPVLHHWDDEVSVDVVAWVPVESDDLDGRVRASVEAMSLLIGAIRGAIDDNTSALYRAESLTVSAGSIDSDADPTSPGAAQVVLVVGWSNRRAGAP
jgi:hypothetical protein